MLSTSCQLRLSALALFQLRRNMMKRKWRVRAIRTRPLDKVHGWQAWRNSQTSLTVQHVRLFSKLDKGTYRHGKMKLPPASPGDIFFNTLQNTQKCRNGSHSFLHMESPLQQSGGFHCPRTAWCSCSSLCTSVAYLLFASFRIHMISFSQDKYSTLQEKPAAHLVCDRSHSSFNVTVWSNNAEWPTSQKIAGSHTALQLSSRFHRPLFSAPFHSASLPDAGQTDAKVEWNNVDQNGTDFKNAFCRIRGRLSKITKRLRHCKQV